MKNQESKLNDLARFRHSEGSWMEQNMDLNKS